MKKIFIRSKKSARTFKLRIEPYFLSHAERGESFQNQDFVGGNAEQTALRADHIFGSETLFEKLRRRRDLNSRTGYPIAWFRIRCLQPLSHISRYVPLLYRISASIVKIEIMAIIKAMLPTNALLHFPLTLSPMTRRLLAINKIINNIGAASSPLAAAE